MKALVCKCGSVFVSNGREWHCPFGSDTNYQHCHPIPDRRVHARPQDPKAEGTPGQVGLPGERQARRKNCKQRSGPMAADFSAVGPEAAAKYRNLRSRFQGGRKSL